MAYSKTTWTNGTTPVDASNMNKIESALADQDERIDETAPQYFATYDELLAFTDSMSVYQVCVAALNAAATQEVLGVSTASKGFITKMYSTSSSYDFFLIVGAGQNIYVGRCQNGTITSNYRLTTTAV